MTVGAGGRAGQEGIVGQVNRGATGSSSSITYPGPNTVVTTTGGGAGANGNTEGPAGPPASNGDPGGSGGGADNSGTGGAATNYPGPTQQGFLEETYLVPIMVVQVEVVLVLLALMPVAQIIVWVVMDCE